MVFGIDCKCLKSLKIFYDNYPEKEQFYKTFFEEEFEIIFPIFQLRS